MRSKKGVMKGLILVMLLLGYTFSIYAQEETNKEDLSVKGMIRGSSISSSDDDIDEGKDEELDEEDEELEIIDISRIAIAEDEEEELDEEIEVIDVSGIGMEEEELEEDEEEIGIFIAPAKEEKEKFNFISWLKKILGIKEVEEETIYIAPDEIIIDEEEEEIRKITEIEDIRPVKPIRREVTEETSAKEGAQVIIVKETDLINLVPNAYDPDKDLLKYTFTTPLDQEGKWQTNYGNAGEYTITVTASDGELSSSKEVLIIVNRKEETPSIDSFGPETSSLEANENSVIEFEAKASDLNKDKLTYDWKLDGKEVSSDQEYTYDITYDDAGSHTMKLTVSDGKLETNKLWSIKVKNVNRLPVLEKIPDIQLKETDTIRISPKATDPDGDELKFTISEPVGNTGVWKTTYDDSGEYTIEVTASDGIDSTSQEVKITVENVNRAPVITDILQR